ncbi:MAG: response regulator transcription factor, partial [Marinoscillum sp.]
LSEDLQENGFLVAKICQSGEEALEVVDKKLPDLVLMDIKLQGKLDGIQVTERILKKYRIPIIYLTDIKDKNIVAKANGTKPSNYLTKPFQTHQLLIAVDLALFKGAEEVIGQRVGFFKQDNQHVKIVYQDILYILADGAYCEIYTLKGKTILTRSLNQVLKRIPYPDLIRVHKSYCVNRNHVDRIMKKIIYVGDKSFKVGETYESVLAEHFDLI